MLALSSIVMIEPAPCDLLFVVVFTIAIGSGYSPFPTGVPPAIFITIYLFLWANLVSMFFVLDIPLGIKYFAITIYMFLSFQFIASLIGRHGRNAVELIYWGLVFAATIAAVVGLLANFRLIPRADIFFRDEFGMRVKSTFKDPNVFAPFLVAVNLLVLWKTLEEEKVRLLNLGLIALFSVSILLAFSRGAYVHFAVSLMVMIFLHVVVIRDPRTISRLFVLGGFAIVVGVPLMIFTLIESGLLDFLFDRLTLKSYDQHRFSRHDVAVQLVMDWPLGIGPGQFTGQRFEAAVHSLYFRVLSENGLLGFIAFLGFLLVWFRVCITEILHRSKYVEIHTVCLAIVTGALVESNVIDTLHWRHLFLIMAIPIGLRAHEIFENDQRKYHGHPGQ